MIVKYFLFFHVMASEGALITLTSMQGQELKALLKETIRELLQEDSGLLGIAAPSSAEEKPHIRHEPHGEFCSVAQTPELVADRELVRATGFATWQLPQWHVFSHVAGVWQLNVWCPVTSLSKVS